jgi:hypothetical protein
VDAIYGGEILLTQRFLDEGYAVFALSSLMKGKTISRLNEEEIVSICNAWQENTVLKLGDPYYSTLLRQKEEEVSTRATRVDLVDPHDLLFFKTNIDPSYMSEETREKVQEATIRKVAFCFAGDLRSFNNENVFKSISLNLIDSLCNSSISVDNEEQQQSAAGAVAAVPCEPSIFFVVGDSESDVNASAGLKYFQDKYAKKKNSVRGGSLGSDGNVTVLHSIRFDNADRLAQVWKLDACFNLVRSSSKPFEFVVRARPDMAWLTPVPDISSFASNRLYLLQNNFFPANDQFFMIPRALFNKIADFRRTYDSIMAAAPITTATSTIDTSGTTIIRIDEEDDPTIFPNGAGYPDCFFWKHIINSQVNFQFFDFDTVIVRDNNRARCNSLFKTHNFACSVLATYDGNVAGDTCVDMFNSLLSTICRETFSVSNEDKELGIEGYDYEAEWQRFASRPRIIEEKTAEAAASNYYSFVVNEMSYYENEAVGYTAHGFAIRASVLREIDRITRYRRAARVDDETNAKAEEQRASTREFANAMNLLWSESIAVRTCIPSCSKSEMDSIMDDIHAHVRNVLQTR